MKVELVHFTTSGEELIVEMARVSNPSNAKNTATAPKLLRYLIEHEHWSPFEMASMCVRIHTERDISAQIIRHRSFSFQEYSTRYAKTIRAELPALRRQDTTNRQNSFDDLPKEVEGDLTIKTAELLVRSHRLYQEMLDAGVAKETARRIMPLCTPTTIYMYGTIRSWIHYLKIRTGVETQLEHRLIANDCKHIFSNCFPTISDACF